MFILIDLIADHKKRYSYSEYELGIFMSSHDYAIN